MAKESSVAPKERINITFKPATGGAQEEIELPLKLLVVGDYIQRFDGRKLEDRKPIAIDKMTFDEVLSKQGLELALNVPNRLHGEDSTDELAIALRVSAMKDFNPASLHLVEALRTLRLIHYAGWIAKRWSDPAFPAAFGWFDTPRYWQDQILALREQIALMDESPLVRQF